LLLCGVLLGCWWVSGVLGGCWCGDFGGGGMVCIVMGGGWLVLGWFCVGARVLWGCSWVGGWVWLDGRSRGDVGGSGGGVV